MGIFFTSGQKMIRPGVYQRYENIGGPQLAGAFNGVASIVVKSNWGELSKVHIFDNTDGVTAVFGTGGKNGTVSDIMEVFAGGASVVKVVRLGNGGTKGSAMLKDTTADTPKDAVNITALTEGDRAFTYSVRGVIGDSAIKEFVLMEGTTILERLSFKAGMTEVDSLVSLNGKSKYVQFSRVPEYVGTGVLAGVSNENFPIGENPVITNADYSSAFLLLETERWNTIAVDTCDAAVHALLAAYIDRVYRNGKMAFAVVGEPTSIPLETRMSHAKAFNSYKVVYVGGGFVDTLGGCIEGHACAARIAGMVAAVPCSESITHRSMRGAVSPVEVLTNSMYEQCILSGILTFSTSSMGVTWIESAVTSLVSLEGQDDEGWKKIKRSKIRFELMTRCSDTVEPLIGNIPNNSDGRSTVLKAVQGICNVMISEQKLLPGAKAEIDKANPPAGDSAWFIITADDVDALEKIYFVYKFRFAPTV